GVVQCEEVEGVVDAAAVPVRGPVVLHGRVIDGDPAEDGEDPTTEASGLEAAVPPPAEVPVDLAPAGDGDGCCERADAAAPHQEKRVSQALLRGARRTRGRVRSGAQTRVGADVLEEHGNGPADRFLVREDVVIDLAAAGDREAAQATREVDEPAADRRAGVAADLAAAADRDRTAEVGGDAAAGAPVRVARDLTAVGDRHAAEANDNAAAVHADGVVVADLAGGDVAVAGALHPDPAAPEIPASGIAQCRGGVAVDGAATDHPHGVAAAQPDAPHADASLIKGRVAIDVTAAADEHAAGLHVDATAGP